MSTKTMRVAVFCICLWHFIAAVDKRLLMDNSDSIGSTLKSLELEIQQLKTQQTSSENEVTNLKNQLQAATEDMRQVKAKLQTSDQELLRVNSQLTFLEKENADLNTQMKRKTIGETYVRWGRKDCPSGNTTELVYSGIVGGTSFGVSGGSVEYICLPHDPSNVSSQITTIYPTCFSGVHGSEYQLGYKNVKLDDDVPCAVCHTKSSSTLMVPAHNSCPTGWKKEYQGLLCTGNDADKMASEYVCLDNDPEFFEGTRSHNDNGKLFYPTKAVCGSLPCPPYQNNQFLPCIVCSK